MSLALIPLHHAQRIRRIERAMVADQPATQRVVITITRRRNARPSLIAALSHLMQPLRPLVAVLASTRPLRALALQAAGQEGSR